MSALLELLSELLVAAGDLPWRYTSVALALMALTLALTCGVILMRDQPLSAVALLATAILGGISLGGAAVDWLTGRRGRAVLFAAAAGIVALSVSSVWFAR